MKRLLLAKGPLPIKRRQRGMSLIETMIALAILGFGVLGAAAAQITAVKFARESRLRTEASTKGDIVGQQRLGLDAEVLEVASEPQVISGRRNVWYKVRMRT